MRNRYSLLALVKKLKRRVARKSFRMPARSDASVQAYRRALNVILHVATRFARERLIPAARTEGLRLQRDEASDIRALLNELEIEIEAAGGIAESMVERILRLEEHRHRNGFIDIVKSLLGVDLDLILDDGDLYDEMQLMLQRNIDLITNISEDVRQRIGRETWDAVLEGKTQKQLADELMVQFDLVQSRATLIARDQMSKLVGQLNEFRQTQAGVEEYEWSTVKDERVRDSHWAMEEMICRWDDETVYREPDGKVWLPRSELGGVELHPGFDFNCRCVPYPVLDWTFGGRVSPEEIGDGLRVQRAA
jgi:SPP1 gp7 family putative phage head morphogenesis protein